MPIGRWVLRTACKQAAAWRNMGHLLGMSVNISARQLDHDDLVSDVAEAIARTELDPTTLALEITETTLMRDSEAAAQRLRDLKDLGVRIAIDDFGTGYCSLAYLRQFPVDALKIDRSFITGIAASHESKALIHMLVQLGKTLGLETLGEGIEEQAQLRQLQREECDSGQGFLFARPVEPDAIVRVLDSIPNTAQPTGEHRPTLRQRGTEVNFAASSKGALSSPANAESAASPSVSAARSPAHGVLASECDERGRALRARAASTAGRRRSRMKRSACSRDSQTSITRKLPSGVGPAM